MLADITSCIIIIKHVIIKSLMCGNFQLYEDNQRQTDDSRKCVPRDLVSVGFLLLSLVF